MRHTEFTWHTAAGQQIFAQQWVPPTPPQGVICLVHGLGEYSGRYGHLASALTGAGYALVSFDHCGHGRSEGRRGDASSYTALLDNIGRALIEIKERYPGLPCFLYGHSMGGNLTLNYILRRRPRLSGVVVTAPWLRVASPPPGWQLKLLSLVERLWPALTLGNRLDPTALSRNGAVVRAYQADPLIHDRISVRLFLGLYRAGHWALEQAGQFSPPLLLIHGSADRLTDPAASREFAARVPGDCTFKLWPDLYHEPHNEPEQQELFVYIIDWLDAHVQENK